MSLKLDDLELSRKKGDVSAELRVIDSIYIADKRSLVELEIPGKDGNLLQDMGRQPAKIVISGQIMGENSRQILESLLSKQDENKPSRLVTEQLDAVGIENVLIENLSYIECSGTIKKYEYRLILKEIVNAS